MDKDPFRHHRAISPAPVDHDRTGDAHGSPLLIHDRQGLSLRMPDDDRQSRVQVRVDFTTRTWQGRLARVRGEHLIRAMGRSRPAQTRILDATAGLGRDTFLLAAAGYQVLSCERHPLLAALIEDGLGRARRHPRTVSVAGRIAFRQADARQVLRTEPAEVDIVYLDPMFTDRSGTAQVKKELQLIRHLVGTDPDMEELFELARRRARLRVVVKRARRAEHLAGRRPDYCLDGKTVRFDVYLAASRRD